jgi:hypothetical protein
MKRSYREETCDSCGTVAQTLESVAAVGSRYLTRTGRAPATRYCYKCKKWYCGECISAGWNRVKQDETTAPYKVKQQLWLSQESRYMILESYCPHCGRCFGGDPNACFVATAALGTSSAWQLDVLREFRDQTLLRSELGMTLVCLYMRCSPRFAAWLDSSPWARWSVRTFLISPVAYIIRALLFRRD